MTDRSGLRAALDGELLEVGSSGYDAARRPAGARFAVARPELVVRCRSQSDVLVALEHARRIGIPVAVRGGGHCFAGPSSTDAMQVDLTGLHGITVHTGGRTTLGAGCRLGHVHDALHAHGRTLAAGCGATVGIVGLTLGGGIGLLGRVHGLTCDSLVAARVVLADGRVVDRDHESEPDLFWALRGAGGGQFGWPPADLRQAARAPTRIEVCWPAVPVGSVVTAWQEWAPSAPDEVTANLTVSGGRRWSLVEQRGGRRRLRLRTGGQHRQRRNSSMPPDGPCLPAGSREQHWLPTAPRAASVMACSSRQEQ